MANKPSEIIKIANQMISNKYVYVYGYKGEKVTANKVESLAKLYPSVFTSSIKKLALNKVGKYGIDCSGFVCKSAGISHVGSSQINSISPKKWSISDLSHVQNGMFIWKNGHIGLIEVDNKGQRWILEAQSTANDLKRTKFESRYKAFTHYGMIKGITYDEDTPKKSTATNSNQSGNPYSKPIGLVRKGMKGNQVKWVQWELNESDYSLKVDGDFGNDTEKFVKEFQKVNGLTADGIVGIKTINAFVNSKADGKVLGYIKVVSKTLSYRNAPTWSKDAVCGAAKKGDIFTVIDKKKVSNTYMYQSKSKMWLTSLPEYVKFAKNKKDL